MKHTKPLGWFSVIGPGILLAATGVGAGDLLTTSLAGSQVGLGLLWAVLVGALLKFTLTEGLMRWQLATDTTLLEGWSRHLGHWIRWIFLLYLLLFTLVVGGALVTACGVAGAGLIRIGDPDQAKIFWGIVHSILGLVLVWYGRYELFKTLMSILVGIMFVTVVVTAVVIGPDWSAVARGFVPRLPAGGETWLLAVLGGVGGTVTLLSYGYWIREEGREGVESLNTCRLDLAVGNAATALFGISALIIGSGVTLEGRGPLMAILMGEQLAERLGPWAMWLFLVGFWGAVFSSLLGVWQSVPYLFADFLELNQGQRRDASRSDTLHENRSYRAYLVFIATVPLLFLWGSVQQIQITYGVIGAFFLPLLALTLLVLNNRRGWVGTDFLNSWLTNSLLVATLLFFAYVGGRELYERLSQSLGT